MRNRLIKLMWQGDIDSGYEYDDYFDLEFVADYLIENGVLIPPCKIGDTLWVAFDDDMEIEPHVLSGICFFKGFDRLEFEDGSCFSIWYKKWDDYFGKRIFLTEREARLAGFES
jgi:hypothetical protein